MKRTSSINTSARGLSSLRRRVSSLSGLLLSLALAVTSQAQTPAAPASTVVHKTAEDFAGQKWAPSQWNTATATMSTSDEKAPDASTEKSLLIDLLFPGGGDFLHATISPVAPLYIPGNAKKISFRVKRSDDRFGLKFGFKDGWGREKANGKDFTWEPKLGGPNEWTTVVFDVPDDWVKPVSIGGVTTHNFSFKDQKINPKFWLDDIEADTDVANVDPATGALKGWTLEPSPPDKNKAFKSAPVTPLLTVGLSTPEIGNVFTHGQGRVALQFANWKPGTLVGQATLTVQDDTGATVAAKEQKLNVESTAAYDFPIEMKRNGLYHVTASLALADGAKIDKRLTMARVPEEAPMTLDQKLASPYGLNYHGGGERLFEPFAKAGIIWYRDYAFGLELMLRAKGNDRHYAGWPYYPTILADYEKLGLMVMPIINGIRPPEMKDGKAIQVGPDEQWVRDVADILITFPQIKYWELDNEYDLRHTPAEDAVAWKNYELYHHKFAELVELLSSGKDVAVEQGRAGIFPIDAAQFVKSGEFSKIGVLNSHHYCGADSPDENAANFNTNQGSEHGSYGTFFDNLRATKRAASVDGKKREAWLTEFGWDNLAGPIVTPEQQAAYLQRGFMVAFAAGTDKAFWFFHFDAEKPANFFDGCGLMTWDKQPKLSLCSMAGIIKLMPRPHFIGSIEAGPNSAGYVFESDGQLIASMWALEGDKGPLVTFQAKELYDYFGNRMSGLSAPLKMAPVYALGLDKKDPLYQQTAYTLETPYLVAATAGDPVDVVLSVKNNRDAEMKGKIKMNLPTGWTAATNEADFSVAPGASQEVKLPFTVNADEPLGPKPVSFTFQEGGATAKTTTMRVMVRRPFTLQLSALAGKPGPYSVDVRVGNKSAKPQSAKLSLKLPAGWQVVTPTVEINDLKPEEVRNVKMDLVWKPEWKENESALASLEGKSGKPLTAPIIPNQYHLNKAGAVTIDGKLDEWPAALELPAWMLGCTNGEPDARIWLGWSPEGLYGAVEVKHSKVQTEDPRAFWNCDALELFVSLDPAKDDKSFRPGDHQFWLSPLPAEKRAYVGQWRGKDEIPETRYDLPGIKSFARKTADGYVMEFLLPSTSFQGGPFTAGATIGLNVNLSVRGAASNREVYWTHSKAEGVNINPLLWGQVKLNP